MRLGHKIYMRRQATMNPKPCLQEPANADLEENTLNLPMEELSCQFQQLNLDAHLMNSQAHSPNIHQLLSYGNHIDPHGSESLELETLYPPPLLQTPPPHLSKPDGHRLGLYHFPEQKPSSYFARDIPLNEYNYDPFCLLSSGLPQQPPMFSELLFQSPSPQSSYGSTTTPYPALSGTGGLYSGEDGTRLLGDQVVLDFSGQHVACVGEGRKASKVDKPFTTESQKRKEFNGMYMALKALVPNPTKSDRASVVADAIEYIKELRRTVEELKLLVQRRRCGRERRKKQKTEGNEDVASIEEHADFESSNLQSLPLGYYPDQSYISNTTNGPAIRTSWLQRKSKDTEVEVRIVENEVDIKFVQRKKLRSNCLLLVSKVLDELQSDLQHVAGGYIGDCYSFLFNSKEMTTRKRIDLVKPYPRCLSQNITVELEVVQVVSSIVKLSSIYEGSSVYAGVIAKNLVEAVDRKNASATNRTSCH